jgi:hypothetical protein
MVERVEPQKSKESLKCIPEGYLQLLKTIFGCFEPEEAAILAKRIVTRKYYLYPEALEKLKSQWKDPQGRLVIKEFVDQQLASLTERQSKILQLRFGLSDGYPRKLSQIGQIFSISRERIRQIEVRSISKLRLNIKNEYLSKKPGWLPSFRINPL